MNKNLLYRSIPKVDILLADEGIKVLIETYSRESVMEAIHSEMEKLRAFIGVCEEEEKAKQQIALLNENIAKAVSAMHTPNMKKVINGTGTILHTNLGRAPISFGHMMRAAEIVSGYSNLEYNLEAGRRGERYSHFEKLLCKLTGAEAAMAVNNNASSVLLILSSLAKGGEVIVSRGELIEIGGKFRIPDVMEQSGANLVEVGTTNKTHYEDYEEAITEETKALLKVHTSNYRIVGFTESVGIDELVPIAKEHGIPVVEDLGSGVLINLEKYGLTHEPTVQESIAHGADVVCFSGDKLLGGPQAGIIIGKKKYIDMMKKNQLTRALRIDKFTAAALEMVLMEYLSEETAVQNIPVLRMIAMPLDEIEKEALKAWNVDMLTDIFPQKEEFSKDAYSPLWAMTLPDELEKMLVALDNVSWKGLIECVVSPADDFDAKWDELQQNLKDAGLEKADREMTALLRDEISRRE